MDRKKWIIAGISLCVLVLVLIVVFSLKGCLNSGEDIQDVPESTGTLMDNSGSGGKWEEQESPDYIQDSTDAQVEYSDKVFYLRLNNGMITIYNDNGEFYDYAQVNVEYLPEDVLSELKMGMEIVGEDSLYEFLQGYAK